AAPGRDRFPETIERVQSSVKRRYRPQHWPPVRRERLRTYRRSLSPPIASRKAEPSRSVSIVMALTACVAPAEAVPVAGMTGAAGVRVKTALGACAIASGDR